MRTSLAIAIALAVTTIGCEAGSAGPAIVVGSVPVTIEWEEASEAVDFDRLRDLFAEDGAFFTGGDVEALHAGNDDMRDALGVDGWEFIRRHTIHTGGDLSVIDPVQVGERSVAFGWAWKEFGAGAGTMALRDGRIAVLTLTVSPVTGGVSSSDDLDPILGEFEAASESGEEDQVRALFDADGVFMTSFELLDLYHGETALEGARGIEGQAPAGWVADHRGEDLDIAHAIQVDTGIAFAWVWEGGDAGTAVMELGEGRIRMLVITDADEEI